MIHKKSLSPQVFEKVELLKFLVVCDKEIENEWFFVLKYSFGLCSVAVIEIEQELVVHILVPTTNFSLFAILTNNGCVICFM